MTKQAWMDEDQETWQHDADIYDDGGRKGERKRRRRIIENEQISDSIF